MCFLVLKLNQLEIGKVNLKDSYANIKNGEAYIYSMHISPYEQGNIFNKDPLRDRKLLLNKNEINKLVGLIKQKAYIFLEILLNLNLELAKVRNCMINVKTLQKKMLKCVFKKNLANEFKKHNSTIFRSLQRSHSDILL